VDLWSKTRRCTFCGCLYVNGKEAVQLLIDRESELVFFTRSGS